MNIANLRQVNQLDLELGMLKRLLADADTKMRVTIDGHALDDAIVYVALPAVRVELAARINQCKAELRQLGVEV